MMWRLLVLVSVAPVFTVPVTKETSASRLIPNKIGLRPATRDDTNNAGGGNSKWQQLLAPAFSPISCNCPEANGWTPEELEEHNHSTNLTGGSNDCFCSNSNHYWLTSSLFGEHCSCPSVEGWSLEDLLEYNSISNINGTASDCFCSYLGEYTIQDLIPCGPAEVNCTCPNSDGWTEDQLHEIQQVTNLTAMFNECFCEGENEYSIRKKVIHPVFGGLDDHDEDDSEEEDESSGSSEENNTEVLITPINSSSLGNDEKDYVSTTEGDKLTTTTGSPPSKNAECSNCAIISTIIITGTQH